MPKYIRIAGKLRITGEQMFCYGPIVVSSKAMFILPERYKSQQQAGMAAAGAVGAVLGALMSSPSRAFRKYVQPLPAAVTDHSDWPLRKKPPEAVVLIKDQVRYLRYPWWGPMAFEIGDETIQ